MTGYSVPIRYVITGGDPMHFRNILRYPSEDSMNLLTMAKLALVSGYTSAGGRSRADHLSLYSGAQKLRALLKYSNPALVLRAAMKFSPDNIYASPRGDISG